MSKMVIPNDCCEDVMDTLGTPATGSISGDIADVKDVIQDMQGTARFNVAIPSKIDIEPTDEYIRVPCTLKDHGQQGMMDPNDNDLAIKATLSDGTDVSDRLYKDASGSFALDNSSYAGYKKLVRLGVGDYELFGIAKRGRKIEELGQQTTDITQAAKFSRSRAIIDSYEASVVVDGWKYDGHIWTPGEIITVKAPGAYIFDETRLIIKRTSMTIDESGGQITVLDLGLPEAFDNSDPKGLPWV